MNNKTITMELELDGQPTYITYKDKLRPDHIYFLDIPHMDLHPHSHARVKVTISETEEEP